MLQSKLWHSPSEATLQAASASQTDCVKCGLCQQVQWPLLDRALRAAATYWLELSLGGRVWRERVGQRTLCSGGRTYKVCAARVRARSGL